MRRAVEAERSYHDSTLAGDKRLNELADLLYDEFTKGVPEGAGEDLATEVIGPFEYVTAHDAESELPRLLRRAAGSTGEFVTGERPLPSCWCYCLRFVQNSVEVEVCDSEDCVRFRKLMCCGNGGVQVGGWASSLSILFSLFMSIFMSKRLSGMFKCHVKPFPYPPPPQSLT